MRRLARLLPLFPLSLLGLPAFGQGTQLACVAQSPVPAVRVEGLAEQLGDIVLVCSGGAPSTTFTTNLTVALSIPVTSKVIAPSTVDVVLTSENTTVPVTVAGQATLELNNRVAFNGITLTTTATGGLNLRIANLRGAVAGSNVGSIAGIQASLSSSNRALTFPNPNVVVAQPLQGLLATTLPAVINCGVARPITGGSVSSLAGRFPVVATRVTEGFATAFAPRTPTSDQGTRIAIRVTDVPQGIRLFAPDVIVGSSGVTQTSSGEFGVPAGPGEFNLAAPNALLLARVVGTDANGAGGFVRNPITPNQTGPAVPDVVAEVPLTGTTAILVYEVVAGDPNRIESAQLFAFAGVDAPLQQRVARPVQGVSFAPLSTVAAASDTAPVPRFSAVTPPTDCGFLNDCGAPYFPQLSVDLQSLSVVLPAGGGPVERGVYIRNAGGGVLFTDISFTLQNGANWLQLIPGYFPAENQGFGDTTIRVFFSALGLSPGTYRGSIRLNAGAAGDRTLPVTLEVTPTQNPPTQPPTTPPPPPRAQVQSVVNAASSLPGPVAAGSLATLYGSRFNGQNVQVTFDGVPARILFANEGQINLEVPSALGTRTSAQVIVTVDGVASSGQTISLVPFAPAIFRGGVVNQNGSPNSTTNAATVGDVLVVYATGLLSPAGGTITAEIHDRVISTPTYAGPAPGLVGLQQVNFVIPADLPAMTTEVKLCVTPTQGGQRICSLPALVTLQR